MTDISLLHKGLDSMIHRCLRGGLSELSFRRIGNAWTREVCGITQVVTWEKVSPIHTHGLPERYLDLNIFHWKLFELRSGPSRRFTFQGHISIDRFDRPPGNETCFDDSNISIQDESEVSSIVRRCAATLEEFIVPVCLQCESLETMLTLMSKNRHWIKVNFELSGYVGELKRLAMSADLLK